MGYDGVIIFDTAKPDGQMRKKMNSDKMRKYLDFHITDFDVALQETIEWYISKMVHIHFPIDLEYFDKDINWGGGMTPNYKKY